MDNHYRRWLFHIIGLRKLGGTMRTTLVSLVALAAIAISGCATPGDGASWKCSAQGLVNSHYTGSDYAMIHLQGYSSGGNYKVTKNTQDTEATGTTANGTPFKCVKSQ
jgi:hypothetical protein